MAGQSLGAEDGELPRSYPQSFGFSYIFFFICFIVPDDSLHSACKLITEHLKWLKQTRHLYSSLEHVHANSLGPGQ